MILHRMVALLVLIGLGLISVTPTQAQPKSTPDIAQAVQDNNAFALELHAKLAAAEGNLFYSPYSISTALAMTYAGARGDTAGQMAKTMHYSLENDRLHGAFSQLIRNQEDGGKKHGYQLSVANGLFGQQFFIFQPDFLGLVKMSYGAGLREVDFIRAPDEARKLINAWVAKETKDKIKDLLQPGTVKEDMRLVLANAIYFKSGWLDRFAEGNTKKEKFFLAGEKTTDASMMTRNAPYAYYENENLQLLEMPYERRDLSMIAILPKRRDGLADVEKSLTAARVDEWLKSLKRYQVDVKFPKFKSTAEFNLTKVLSDMGMPLAFTPAADFSGISTQQKLFIGFVIHKAYIDLNEKGTEAAAATAVGIVLSSAPNLPQDKASFHADHPFVYLIRDNRTGSILFVGRVMNPA